MPYQQSVTYQAGASGNQASINLDPSIASFHANIACIVGGGATASYKLQYTLDNFDSASMTDAAATWFDSSDIPAGTTGSATSSLLAPVTRIRVNISSLSGGTLTLKAVQGLSAN